jgi:5,10-methenyltetrahydrofolate synthetase
MPDPEDLPSEYASPPCFMHELMPEFRAPSRDSAWRDVTRWRRAERERLIGERLTWSADRRLASSETIARKLDEVIGKAGNRIISLYWPFKGEPDLRNWLIQLIERGGRIALPVVVEKNAPLEFRLWSPGEPLERGIWNILVPAHGVAVMPDIVIAPVVGFDAANYRLGYGGGYFDRTLAAAPRKPLAIGIGYGPSRVSTIYPQPHDIAMDLIVTDE